MDTSIWWTTVDYSPIDLQLQKAAVTVKKQTNKEAMHMQERESHSWVKFGVGSGMHWYYVEIWYMVYDSDVFCNHLCFCRQPCHFHLSHLGCFTGFNGESKILWLFQCVCLHTNTDFLFLFQEHCSIQNITCSCSPVYFSPDTSMTHQKREKNT